MPSWKKKVLLQRAISMIPFGEQTNFLLQAVRRSRPGSGMGVAAEVRDRLPLVGALIRRLAAAMPLEGAAVLEVGTGWTPLPTLLLHLAGVRSIRTYDILRRARWHAMHAVVRTLAGDPGACALAIGQPRRDVERRLAQLYGATSMNQLLRLAGIEYIAPGDASATGLPDGSIDLFFAYSVYENIPLPVLHAFCREAKRLLRPDTGRFCAELGCGDTYSSFDPSLHILDYLQYSDPQWDRLVNNHNHYHFNRIREPEFLELLEAHGAVIEGVEHTLKPDHVDHLRHMQLPERFARFTPEQNAVVKTEVIASFPAQAAASSSGTSPEQRALA